LRLVYSAVGYRGGRPNSECWGGLINSAVGYRGGCPNGGRWGFRVEVVRTGDCKWGDSAEAVGVVVAEELAVEATLGDPEAGAGVAGSGRRGAVVAKGGGR
jgi:hypothetical protein